MSSRVNELEERTDRSRDELVERLTTMLKNERKHNQDLIKRLQTLELKYLASQKVRKKLKSYIIRLRENSGLK